jgi:hypothetical protein
MNTALEIEQENAELRRDLEASKPGSTARIKVAIANSGASFPSLDALLLENEQLLALKLSQPRPDQNGSGLSAQADSSRVIDLKGAAAVSSNQRPASADLTTEAERQKAAQIANSVKPASATAQLLARNGVSSVEELQTKRTAGKYDKANANLAEHSKPKVKSKLNFTEQILAANGVKTLVELEAKKTAERNNKR